MRGGRGQWGRFAGSMTIADRCQGYVVGAAMCCLPGSTMLSCSGGRPLAAPAFSSVSDRPFACFFTMQRPGNVV